MSRLIKLTKHVFLHYVVKVIAGCEKGVTTKRVTCTICKHLCILYPIFLAHLHEIVFILNTPTTSQVDSSFMNESRVSIVRHVWWVNWWGYKCGFFSIDQDYAKKSYARSHEANQTLIIICQTNTEFRCHLQSMNDVTSVRIWQHVPKRKEKNEKDTVTNCQLMIHSFRQSWTTHHVLYDGIVTLSVKAQVGPYLPHPRGEGRRGSAKQQSRGPDFGLTRRQNERAASADTSLDLSQTLRSSRAICIDLTITIL